MYQRKLSLLLLLFSAIGGCLGFIAGELLLSHWEGQLPNALAMGVYFGLTALFTGLLCLAAELISPVLNGRGWRQRHVGYSWKALVPATLGLLFVAAALLQLVYGLAFREAQPPRNVVLAIDVSGSMKERDPDKESFQAAAELVQRMEDGQRVAVIVFNDEASLLQPFVQLDSGGVRQEVLRALANYELQDGGTEIEKALELSMEQLNTVPDPDRSMVLLISDGYSNVNLTRTLTPYRGGNIPIHTIGVSPDDMQGNRLLNRLAARTGGSFHSVDNVQELSQIFSQIYKVKQEWHLVGERTGNALFSSWYAWLRVISVGLLGSLMGLSLGAIFDNRFLAKSFAIGGGAAGLAAGLILEWGLKGALLLDWETRAVAVLVLSLVLALSTVLVPFKKTKVEEAVESYRDGYSRPYVREPKPASSRKNTFKS